MLKSVVAVVLTLYERASFAIVENMCKLKSKIFLHDQPHWFIIKSILSKITIAIANYTSYHATYFSILTLRITCFITYMTDLPQLDWSRDDK